MNDLLHTYEQLSETHRRQLIAYADILLTQQKIKRPENDLSAWKAEITNVSTWSEKDIQALNENSKHLNQWKIPEW